MPASRSLHLELRGFEDQASVSSKTLSFRHVAWQKSNHAVQNVAGRGSIKVLYKDIGKLAMVPAAHKNESLVGSNYLCIIDNKHCNAGQRRKTLYH